MKAILLSIKPEWAEKIYSGEKTLEIRKSVPRCTFPAVVFLYESGTGLVTGSFTLQGVLHTASPVYFAKAAAMGLKELTDYGPDGRGVYHGWAVEKPLRFTVPYTLASLGIKRPPQSWRYIDMPAE